MLLEAIIELQRRFDLVSADERSVETARLLMDLYLLRRTLFLCALFVFAVIWCQCTRRVRLAPAKCGKSSSSPWLNINEKKGRLTVSKWVLDSRRNALTRRPLKCFELFIGNR